MRTARLAAVAVAAAAVALPALPALASTMPTVQPYARVLRPGCAGPGNVLRARLNNSESTVAITYAIRVSKAGRNHYYTATLPAGAVGVVQPGRVASGQRARVVIRYSGSDYPLASRVVTGRAC